MLTVTANACANRKNLKVRDRKRGAGNLYRELFQKTQRDKSPFVVRNTLSKILSLYGSNLADLGAKIEAQSDKWTEKSARLHGDDGYSDDPDPPEPPVFGNDWQYDGDGTGGAGNIILIHFQARG